jgi:hypothetical protein
MSENPLTPTTPIIEQNGGIELKIYDQEGNLSSLTVRDTRFNRQLVVWCRKFDRYVVQ